MLNPAQRWMKKLDIPTLVRLLPCTLPVTFFKTGQPCDMDVRKLPSPSWLEMLWKCLTKMCRAKDNTNKDGLRETGGILQGLMEWSLLPVKLGSEVEKATRLYMYPLKDMHKVVYLSNTPDRSNQQLWEALKMLHLPFLDTSFLPDDSITTSIVASIGHPQTLLKALHACASSLKPRVDQAVTILRYFNSNISGLVESFGDKAGLLQMLKSLPLYVRTDGKLTQVDPDTTVLCLESVPNAGLVTSVPNTGLVTSVPNAGLVTWATRRQHKLVLLDKRVLPSDLCNFLEFLTPTTPEFFYQYLLPTLHDLPQSDICDHMMAIKRGLDCWPANEIARIIQQLNVTEFLLLNNKLQRANTCYSPHLPVFKVMGMALPPNPYCDKHWECFMQSAGMISQVSQEMFVHFAHVLHEEGRRSLDDGTVRKSEKLVSHLFFREDLDVDFLRQLKDIPFVRPHWWTHTTEEQVLCEIAKPFCTNRLISFANSCRKGDLYLAWSNNCIVHPNADPVMYLCGDNLRNVQYHLGLQEKVPRNKAIQHIQTVCQRLAGNVGMALFATAENSSVVKKVMVALYHYLHETNIIESDITTLKQLPVICDIEHKQMLKPENVVIDLREEEAIQGRIVKAPAHFGNYFELFQRLGVAERVTADHYARVLLRLKTEAADSVLHVEEMKLYVRTAVRELFKCLRSERPDIKRLSVQNVYLPAENGCLMKSTHLAYVDNVALRKRFPWILQGMHFFIRFSTLGIINVMDKDELALLPDEHQVQLLSRIVKEVIPKDVKTSATQGQHSREVERRLNSQDFKDSVIRLAYHQHMKHGSAGPKFTEQTAQQIIQCLARISVLETVGLKTMLMWKVKGVLVGGTECPKKSFVDKCSTANASCTLYLDKQACDQEGTDNHRITKSMQIAVLHTIQTGLNSEYLLLALRNPRDAHNQMDEEGIEPCDFNAKVEQTVFPPPGTFIPLHFHCYLDNNFESFYNGEHVGFEVYDPQVDEYDTDQNDAVYVYAIVIEEVKQEGEVPLLAKHYKIDLGADRGVIEASATRLYKFTRKPNQGTPKAVVKYVGRTAPEGATSATSEPAAPATPARPATPLDFKAVMKEIRQILTDAWQTQDEIGQRRVKKRLYLKWHPDKNMDNEEFCTRVVQLLQHYLELLEQGRQLPEDMDEDEDQVDGSSRSHQSPRSNSRFYDHMNRRSREQRGHFESHARSNFGTGHSSSGGHERSHYRTRFQEDDFESFHHRNYSASSSNPQRGEGLRWFRQAQADLGDAQAASAKLGRGYNWICFICHQAMEKALKAVLYCRDANSPCLKEHSLVTIANAVDDDTLMILARQLEGRVGNHMRMRYPDMLATIPADKYDADDARMACGVSARALHRVKDILGC